MTNNNTVVLGLLVVFFLFIALAVTPFIVIWTLNTLFDFELKYNFTNLLASFCLFALFGRSSITVQKN